MLFAGSFIKHCVDFLPSKFPLRTFGFDFKRKMVGVIIIFVCDHFQGVCNYIASPLITR